jgi:cytochrome oxidase assembly protein ShyY1
VAKVDATCSTCPRWHLKKEVPLALIVTIAIQCLLGIWYASKLDTRKQRVAEVRAWLEARDRGANATVNTTANTESVAKS